jgi:hypothetical protein
MICSNVKSTRLEQFAMTGAGFHEVLDRNIWKWKGGT